MARFRVASGLLVLAATGLLLGQTPSAQTAVPSTVIQITGTRLADDGITTSYRAFQKSGDPFRVICSEPCTADLNAIYGLYAGFATVRQTIVGLFGVAPLAEGQPFDIHIDADRWCGPEVSGIGGISGFYTWFSYTGLASGSFGCFWFTVPGHYALPFQYPDTSTQPFHLITAHEFTHTEFYNRHHYSYEDFANAIAFYIAKPNGGTVTDPCDDYLNVRGSGKLIWGLCQRNGFQYSQLAPAFAALAALYDNGQRQAYNTTSVWQFRNELSKVLGSSALDAFMASKQTLIPQPGSGGTLPAAGGRIGGLNSWLSMLLPAGALSADTPFHVEGAYTLNALPPGSWQFENVYRISRLNGADIPFSGTTYLQVKYNPATLTFGTDESTLRIYQFDGTSFQPLSGGRVDPSRLLVSGSTTSTGTFAVAGSSTTVTPTLVVARAVSNANVHTRLVVRNPSWATIDGQVTFHPQGVAASPSDPTQAFSIAVGKTLVLDDVVAALGASGAGSIDVTATSGGLPEVFAVNVETGSSTFPGSVVPVYSAASALTVGDRAMLTAPGNLQRENFGFVVRTFGAGASFTVTTRDAAGAIVATTPLTYAASTMQQISATAFTGGAAVTAGQSYDIAMQSGSAIVELEEAGHGTSSHDFRLAERVDLSASAPGDTLHLPKAIATANPDGTTVRTSLQLTNPGTSTITGKVRFTPSGGATPSGFNYSIPPGATRTFADVVTLVGQTGAGALDIQSTSGNLPIAFARLIYAGPATPWQVAGESSQGVLDRLQPGDRTILVAPTSASPEFRIGVRTFNKTFAVTMTVYDENGFYMTKLTQSFAAGTTSETSLSSLLGVTPPSGAIVEVLIDGGAGVLYGTAVNAATGAVNYQPARRLAYY